MENVITIIKNDIKLTPHSFYTGFLEDVAKYYKDYKDDIVFKLFENGDNEIFDSYYRIDPIVIPLLLSLSEQLSKYHKNKIYILLYNNPATIDVLEFLYKCDFFYIVGENRNPTYPKGRQLLDFDESYLGAFKGKKLRDEHRVRAYSLNDDGLMLTLEKYLVEEQRRDFLISYYTYKAREHFQELLFDNDSTAHLHNTYLDILSELITNAVLHSQSNAYALMFVDRYKTKFSISDNGVGFEGSMRFKKATSYYEPGMLKKCLVKETFIKSISPSIINNLHTIFETLYYSSLKDRQGLFDLMINVVLHSQGYFRVHSENSQIIISNRMMDELKVLESIRISINEIHTRHELDQIDTAVWTETLKAKTVLMKDSFIAFYNKALDKYSSDIKFSSLRFFKVKFRGVHIEVEIPNAMGYDNIED